MLLTKHTVTTEQVQVLVLELLVSSLSLLSHRTPSMSSPWIHSSPSPPPPPPHSRALASVTSGHPPPPPPPPEVSHTATPLTTNTATRVMVCVSFNKFQINYKRKFLLLKRNNIPSLPLPLALPLALPLCHCHCHCPQSSNKSFFKTTLRRF
jgi:hypothetical protein